MNHLGDAALAAGYAPAARDAWREALATLDGLGVVRVGVGPGYPDAEEIAAKLHRLGGS